MNSVLFSNGLRFIGLLLLQVLVLKRISFDFENFNYINVIAYPIFILLLPIRTPHALLVFLGFLIGFSVDIFYDSLGVHASAGAFSAWIRPYVIAALEPRGGYNINHSPTKKRFGINWFFIYSMIIMLAHLAFYFSVEAFAFKFILTIILKTIFSFLVSMIFIIMYQYLFDPTD